jgi:hypothetical protein
VGRGLWRSTEGKPLGRAAAALGMAAVVGGLIFTWLPNGDYEPIRKGERGTLTEGVSAIAQAPSGRPSLVSEQKAADAGRLVVPEGEEPAVTTTTSPEPSSPATTVPARGTAETTVPAGGASSTTAPPRTTTTEPSTTTTTVRRTTTTASGG